MTDTTAKLNRIAGQVNGIAKMCQDDRSCIEVVQQIAAARSALASVARDLLTDEASRCVHDRKPEEFDTLLKSLFEVSAR